MRNPTPADDNLHPPESDDVFWTETAWFAFASAERRLTGCIYPMFRANLSVSSAGVFGWDDSGEGDHEILYSHNCCHLPLPEDLRAMRLHNGLSYEVVEPLREYLVRYDSDELNIELRYRGLVEPIMGVKGNHLDQPCRVTGHIVLRGEEIPIDCFEMRDKSWEVRSDGTTALAPELAIGSYCYGINTDSAFLCWTTGTSDDLTTAGVRGGWVLRDGVVSCLVAGQRIAERMPSRPAHRIMIEATDELGRSLKATGNTFNNYAMRANPAMLAWVSGVSWDVDGHPASGESQEWSAGSSRASRVRWLHPAESVAATP